MARSAEACALQGQYYEKQGIGDDGGITNYRHAPPANRSEFEPQPTAAPAMSRPARLRGKYFSCNCVDMPNRTYQLAIAERGGNSLEIWRKSAR